MEAIRNLKFIISVGVGIAMLMATIGVAWGSTTVSFSDFTAANLGNFQLNGDTAGLNPNSDNVLRLTTNQNGQAGSAFLFNSISLASDASFSTAFQFQISNPGGCCGGGADGLVFVVQTNNNTAGTGGGGIGYLGIPNSVGVEFDNHNNGGSCEANSGNHVGINLGGSTCSDPVIDVTSLGSLQDGQVWWAWVDYDGDNNLLEVRLTPNPPKDGLGDSP